MASQDFLSNNLYSGLPCPKGAYSIRVLDLQPGDWESGLRGILRVIGISSHQYEALSYTWGGSSENKAINVNGLDVPITNNLFNALRRLRRKRKSRTIWADAICINQGDNSERSQQVALMGNIYMLAASVNVWLGEPQSEPSRMPKWSFISQLWSVFTHSLIYWLWWYQEFEKPAAPGPVCEGLRAVASLLKQDAVAINSAIENASPRWYDRAWVVQEFMQARQVYLYYGRRRSLYSSTWLNALGNSLELSTEKRKRKSMPWATSDDRSTIFSPKHRYIRQLQTFTSDVLRFGNQERNIEWHGLRCPLKDAFDIIQNTQATDPRDKIYSMLDLIDQLEKELISCDYTLPCADVYSKATYALCKSRGDLTALSWVAVDRDGEARLPSWTIDFNHLGDLPRRSYQPVYKLTGSLTNVSFLHYGRQLTVYANLFDTVSHSMKLPFAFRSPPRLSAADHTQLTFFLNRAVQALKLSCREYREATSNERAINYLVHRMLDTDLDSIVCPVTEDMLNADPLNSLVGYSKEREDVYGKMGSLPISQCQARLEYHRQSAVVEDNQELLEESVIWAAFSRWSQATSYNLRKQDDVVRYMGLFLDYAYFAAGAPVLFSTRNGAVGVAPCSLAENDILVFCRSQRQFLVLRPHENCYTFRGLAYVNLFSAKEFWGCCDPAFIEPDTFVLS